MTGPSSLTGTTRLSDLWGREKLALPLRVLDALAGNVKVARFDLDSDELPPEIHAGNSGSAGAHEGVKDNAGERRDKRFYKPNGERGRVPQAGIIVRFMWWRPYHAV